MQISRESERSWASSEAMSESRNAASSVFAFLHPLSLPRHHAIKTLKCAHKHSQRVQFRASLTVDRAAVFDYVSQYTSGSKRDVSRLRVLLDSAGLKLEDAWLLIAARVGDAETVEKLLKSGADPNVADTEGSTSLMRAISRGHVDAARVLLADARIDVKKKNGRWPL